MDIQTIRGFLHAHDETAVFKILGWLSACYTHVPSDVEGAEADALNYFEASLTPDIREAAINTVMRAIEAVVARPPILREWRYSDGSTLPDPYAPYYMAQAQVVHIQRLGSTRDSDSVRLFREDKHALAASAVLSARLSFVGGKTVETIEIPAARWDEKAIRHDYMDRVCAELNRRVAQRAEEACSPDTDDANRRAVGLGAQIVVWQTNDYKQGSDRRRRVWDRVHLLSDALVWDRIYSPEHDAFRDDFREWARFEYARTAVGFLIGPARTR